MTLLNEDELQARLEAIQSGPWSRRATLAQKKLAAPGTRFAEVLARPRIDLDALVLDRRAEAHVQVLTPILKWHLTGRIPTHTERRIRDSFDDALTRLQMIELAIEMGYLPEEQVAEETRTQMVSLLWSEPARRFVREYDYTSIETLATRLNIHGLPERPPRVVDPSGKVHFASFLATHRAIEQNTTCETWLGFLDDYIIRAEEKDDFYTFLRSGKPARSKRRQTLILGAWNFAVMLADFLAPLPEQLQGRFASFYAYWLAKLFGYELSESGYIRSDAWGDNDQDCWAYALKSWFDERAAQEKNDTSDVPEAELFARSVEILKTTWTQVRRALRTSDSTRTQTTSSL